MDEISIYKYVSNKKLLIKEINLGGESPYKIFYTKFKNVYVHPKLWSIITEDFNIFYDFERYLSKYKHQKEILERHNEIKKVSENILQIKGQLFLFGGENNYWHFMIDFIPRLISLKDLSQEKIKIIIPHDLDEKFFKFILKICKLLEINEVSFLKINRGNLIYYFENLTFTSNPSMHFTYYFFHKLLNKTIIKEQKKNLYVMRGDTSNRRVLNENNLISTLKKYNYEIIDCAYLSIAEQIKKFSKAKNIIMPSGAAMANLLFIPDRINVVEIRSNLDGDFSKKINLNNRFYLYLFEKTKKVGQKLRKDIIVNISLIVQLIEEKKIY